MKERRKDGRKEGIEQELEEPVMEETDNWRREQQNYEILRDSRENKNRGI